MATGSISSAGIGSGLDVSTMIDRLMSLEQRPLTLLQTQATAMNSKLSTVGRLQSQFSTLRDKANALTSTTLWNATTVTSADPSAIKVSTGSTATAGSYAVNVSKLAVGQTVSSRQPAGGPLQLSEGSLTIELGSWQAGAPSAGFDPKSGGTPVTIAIGPDDTSLTAIRNKINAAGAGVAASIVTDASGARLSLRSTTTGAEHAFRISAAETSNDGIADNGLSALAFDASAASTAMQRTMSAGNAELTVNGIALTSASNTLTDVVDGLSLSLQKATGSDIEVSVASDTASVKTAITDLVSAFNTLASFIRSQTAYNADSKQGGVLQGDQGTMALQNQLRAVLHVSSSASSGFSRLSDIGIAIKADGTLDTHANKLDNALGNLPELKKLLATDGSDSANSGFARRFKRLADAALGSDGVFETRTSSMKAGVTRNSKSQDAMQQRLDQTRARLQAQYTALDAKMATLTGLSSYMTQQITQFNRSRG